jgi:hypothetical protein
VARGEGVVSGGGAASELGLEEESEERAFFTLWAAGGVPVLLKMGLGEEERVVFTRLVLLLLEVE